MRSDKSLHGLTMFADDVVMWSWSTEHVGEAVFHINARWKTVVWMRETQANGLSYREKVEDL